jgi:hypothetical protein
LAKVWAKGVLCHPLSFVRIAAHAVQRKYLCLSISQRYVTSDNRALRVSIKEIIRRPIWAPWLKK